MSYRSVPERRDLRRHAVLLLPLLAGAFAGILIVALGSPAKLLVAVIGMFGVALAVMRIEWGLAALVFLTYSGLSDVLSGVHGAPPVIWPVVGLLVVAILIRSIFFQDEFRGWLFATALIGLYGAVCFASLMWAADGVRTKSALMELAQAGVIAVVTMILLQNFRSLHKVVWALLAAGILMGTVSVYQYLTGTWSNSYGGFGQAEMRQIAGRYQSYRITGPLGDSNFFAQVMLVLIPLALERIWHERRAILRLAAVWALAVSTLAVIFTFSRGAFIASALLLFVFLIRAKLRPGHWIMLLIAGALLVPFLPDEYTDRMKTLVEVIPGVGEGIRTDSAFRGRASELAAGWLMFLDHPVGGVGFGNYPAYYQQYSQRVGLDSRLADRSAHSTYLQIMAETGILGLIAFGLILWFLLRGLHRAGRTLQTAGKMHAASMVHAYFAGIIGFLTAAIFLHAAYPRFFWLVLAIGFAIQHVVRNELNASDIEPAADPQTNKEKNSTLGDFYAEPSANIR